jgi:hypothetical protein
MLVAIILIGPGVSAPIKAKNAIEIKVLNIKTVCMS